jgi:hypothetical protein
MDTSSIKSATGRTAMAIALAALATLLSPAPASGGMYRVAVCNPGIGARHADAVFQRTSPHYVSEASCRPGDAGLVVRHDGGRTRAGRWGGWALWAPRGTFFSGLGVTASGRRAGGHVPELVAAPLEGPMRAFAAPGPGAARSRLATPARSFAARLICIRPSGCSGGRTASIRIGWLTLRLTDHVPPTLALAGSAFGSGSQRGLRAVQPFGTDVGAGVHRFLLQVNGDPVSAQATRCRIVDGFALRLRPCPAQAGTSFWLQTAGSPFHQGLNMLRVCSADYGLGTGANRTCATRRIRIDNLCPISDTGPGPLLEAHLSRSPADRGQRTARVRGRLRTASGVPVAGARVCVASRVSIAGAIERVVATPTTGSDGRFAAELPPGPNRQVRVAYWWDGRQVAERYLSLRVRARPRLRLRPDHPLHNGRHVRFTASLGGPAADHRWVRIQARSRKRWIELRAGRTNGRGVYRARYRLHATTGRQRYAFRAFVPSQRGYPYRAGHSRVRHATVVGDL